MGCHLQIAKRPPQVLDISHTTNIPSLYFTPHYPLLEKMPGQWLEKCRKWCWCPRKSAPDPMLAVSSMEIWGSFLSKYIKFIIVTQWLTSTRGIEVAQKCSVNNSIVWQRQDDLMIQFSNPNWITKSICLCSITDGTFLRNLYPWRRRTSLMDTWWWLVSSLNAQGRALNAPCLTQVGRIPFLEWVNASHALLYLHICFKLATLPCHVLCSFLPPLPHSTGHTSPTSLSLPILNCLIWPAQGNPFPSPPPTYAASALACPPAPPPACLCRFTAHLWFLDMTMSAEILKKCQNIWILWINNHRAPVETVAQSVCRFVRLLPSLIFLQGCILFYCDTLKH